MLVSVDFLGGFVGIFAYMMYNMYISFMHITQVVRDYYAYIVNYVCSMYFLILIMRNQGTL